MSLPAHIEALLDPGAYPERPARIELRQTHISYLFFTPQYVYKIKKPVNFGFLDFSTLDKRLFYCNEEVRLNERLAPGMYLGVVAVCGVNGRFSAGGPGTAVDYAVKMLRLKSDVILEEMVKSGRATADIIKRCARRIADFHRRASTDARISSFGSIEAVRKNCEENFLQTACCEGTTISKERLDAIRDYAFGFLEANGAIFTKRARDGFIRDCHGDIHLENVSVDDGIRIFDCIEFNERFRFSDTIADIAFLSMDLDFVNRHDLSRALEDEYLAAMNDADGGALLNFYKCYRAYVRGKVDSLKFMESEVAGAEKDAAFLSALRRFHLAGMYASGGFTPMLIIVRGLSGAGKTTLARRLSKEIGAPVLSSDVVRKELFGASAGEHMFAGYEKGIYAEGFTEKTYGELISRGAGLLKEGRTCILDATFSKNRFIGMAREAAVNSGAGADRLRVIELTATDETIRKRISGRLALPPLPGEPVSDMTFDVYQRQKRSFDAVNAPHITCGAELPLDENISRVVKWLFTAT